jgi:predicted nucleic acid-binding Zn ribbon protein
MKPIGRVVEQALKALGVDRDVARADAVRAWADAAESVLGSDARGTRAVRADGDTLVIVVPTAQWAGEIRLRERELITAVVRRAPTSGVTRLRPVPSSAVTTPRP